MHQLRRSVTVLGAAGVLAAGLLPATPAHASTTGWRVNHRVKAGTETAMTAIAALGRADAWTMGAFTAQSGSDVLHPVITRWNGRSWNQVTLPAGVRAKWTADVPLATMAASSDSNLWAFSLDTAHYLRRNGTHWSTGALPVPAGADEVVPSVGVARTPSEVWALGFSQTGQQLSPYAARFDGHAWSLVPVPGSGPIVAASAISGQDIWAVIGTRLINGLQDTTKTPSVVHWNGTAWKKVTLPSRLPGNPSSILARSDHDVWIGGGRKNRKGGTTEYVAHDTGAALHVTTMRAAALAVPFHMIRLVSDGTGGLWGLGADLGLSSSRLWHLTGTKWHGPVRPDFGSEAFLFSLAHPGGTSSVWGVGEIAGRGLIALDGRVP
jgi:hypothetical protein